MTTIYVAAQNSSDADKARADFICDGIGDQEEINAAFAALGGRAGTVRLFDGDYRLLRDDRFELPTAIAIRFSGQSLVGDGHGTVLRLEDNQDCNVIRTIGDGLGHVHVEDLRIEANQSANSGGNWLETNAANFRSTGSTPNHHMGVNGLWANEAFGLNVYMGGNNSFIKNSVFGNAGADVTELIDGSSSEISNNIAIVTGRVGYVYGTDQVNSATIRANKTYIMDGGEVTQEVNRLWPGYYVNILSNNETLILDRGTVNRFVGAYGYQNLIHQNDYRGSTVNQAILINGLSSFTENRLANGTVETFNTFAPWPTQIVNNHFDNVSLITDSYTTFRNFDEFSNDVAFVHAAEGETVIGGLRALLGEEVSFEIVGGADASAFFINVSTGLPEFIRAPDFEGYGSAAGSNSYSLMIRAAGSEGGDAVALFLKVTDANENPDFDDVPALIHGNAGERDVASIAATDPDGDMLTYSIVGGADASAFWIDPHNGRLRFLAAPLEADLSSAAGNNRFHVDVSVSDGSRSNARSIEVVVDPTVLVAAFNSSESDKARADFVCDGVNDEAEINAAFATLQGAGTVRLLGGDFMVMLSQDAAAIVLRSSDQRLIGEGYATAISLVGDQNGSVIRSVGEGLSGVKISKVRILGDGSGVDQVDAGAAAVNLTSPAGEPLLGSTIQNVWFSEIAGTAIVVDGNDLRIQDNSFEGARVGQVRVVGPSSGRIEGNHVSLYEATQFVVDVAAGSDMSIVGNLIAIRDGGSAEVGIRMRDARTGSEISQNNIRIESENGLPIALDVSGPVAVEANAVVGFYFPPTEILVSDGVKLSANYLQAAFVSVPVEDAAKSFANDNLGNVVGFEATEALGMIGDAVTGRFWAPAFTSAGGASRTDATVVENDSKAYVFNALDPDQGSRITYAIHGGEDAALFLIDDTTGELSFRLAPNFETPADADRDNIYHVIVRASDGLLFDTQALRLAVQDLNEAPRFTPDGGAADVTRQVDEGGLFVTSVTAIDPDYGANLTFVLTGEDADRFILETGVFTLRFASAPDFEAPADNNGDNVYRVTVRASDGQLFTDQHHSIAVRGIDDDDLLTGDDGANVLDGGRGADRMVGLGGDDIYYVDDARDLVIEARFGGRDLVYAGVSYSLTNNSEVEILSTRVQAAFAAIDLKGNDLANTLWGNAGVNRLDGAGGADRMIGLQGNDVYYVDDPLDTVVEALGGGLDLVYAGTSYSLSEGSEVEVLSTRVQAAFTEIDLTGNGFANSLWGNAGNNILSGGAGDDRLSGLGGDDLLFGGEGNDVAVFRGSAESYLITRQDGVVQIRDLISSDGDDGSDTLIDIEMLSFSDGFLFLSTMPVFTDWIAMN